MLLEAKRLRKAFGGLCAVDEVDFALEAGSITGIIGPNGAGKTTFFNLISRALPVTSGRILFDGQDVTGLQPHTIARRGVARTFQATTLFEDATALENVLVGYRQRTTSGVWDALLRTARLAREEREAQAAAHDTLDFVGLPDAADRLARDLTQEQQKRLAMALAIVSQAAAAVARRAVGGHQCGTDPRADRAHRKDRRHRRHGVPDRAPDADGDAPVPAHHGARLRQEDRRRHTR